MSRPRRAAIGPRSVRQGAIPPATWVTWGAILAVVFALALLFPPSSDDWRRIAFQDKSLSGYWAQAAGSYVGHNGRIVGNSISFILMEPLWLRAAVKAVSVTGIIAALQMATRTREPWAALAAFAGIFVLPAGLFRESYVWSAGFFNYVPPMIAVLLLVGVLGRSPGARSRAGWGVGVGSFVVAFVGCLFVEHVTVALVALALGSVLAAALVRRVPDPTLIAWAAGAVVGAAVMFASPGLRDVAAHEDAYFSYAASAGDLVEKVVTNYAVITGSFVFSHPALLLLTVVAILACARAQRGMGAVPAILTAGAMVVGGYAIVSRLLPGDHLRCPTGFDSCSPTVLAADVVMLFALLGLVILSGWGQLNSEHDRRVWWALLAATVLMLGPLLIVSPIGPRNLFGPVVTMTALVVLLGRAALDAAARPPLRRAVTLAMGAIALVGVAALFVVNGANARVSAERVRLMEGAVSAGQDRVELPAFTFPSWVHDPNDVKIGNRYYLENPRDIEILFP